MSIYQTLAKRGSEIFLSPDEEYSAVEIVYGVRVHNGKKPQTMRALDKNAFKGFHRDNKSLTGPKELFDGYLIPRLPSIVNILRKISTKEEFDSVSEKITEELRGELSKNIKSNMLQSYNKVRKPIDLLLEHIVAMSSELSSNRKVLVPLLNVPLDSYILESPLIFDQCSKESLNIKEGMTCHDVESKTQYHQIQDFIQSRAKEISQDLNKEFYPIYFDLIWNNRLKRKGKNLFKTNP